MRAAFLILCLISAPHPSPANQKAPDPAQSKPQTDAQPSKPAPPAVTEKQPAANTPNQNSGSVASGPNERAIRIVGYPPRTATDAIAWLCTVILTLAAIVGIIVAILTLRKIAEQTKETARSADATAKSVEAIEKQIRVMENSERPWLLIPWKEESVEIDQPILIDRLPGEYRYSFCMFRVKNFGRSPARVTEFKIQMVVVKGAGDPNGSSYEREGAVPENYVIPQGVAVPTEASIWPDGRITPQETQAIKNQESFLWLCGYFKYIDTLGRENPTEHETRFCYRWVYDYINPLDRDIHKNFWKVSGPREYTRAT